MFEATAPISIFGIERRQSKQDDVGVKRSAAKPSVAIKSRNGKSIFVLAQAMINRERMVSGTETGAQTNAY